MMNLSVQFRDVSHRLRNAIFDEDFSSVEDIEAVVNTVSSLSEVTVQLSYRGSSVLVYGPFGYNYEELRRFLSRFSKKIA